LDESGHRGKHITIDRDSEGQIFEWDGENAEQDKPVVKGEIMLYCTTQFQISITRGWVNSVVLRHSGEVIQTKGTTQGEESCMGEFGFNLDEDDMSDWENRKTKKVVTSANTFQ
jgi:hypothetical protein